MLIRLGLFVAVWIFAAVSPAAHAGIVLYADNQGNLPGDQAWLLFGNNAILSGGSASQTAVAQGVALTTDNAVSAGYGNYIPITNVFKNPAFPSLDRGNGFSLTFEMQLLAESHVSGNRAGFNVVLLSSDLRGIELGFWTDSVWAQDTGFIKAETAMFNTASAENRFDVAVYGNNYTASVNGSAILTGSLRDYSAAGVPYSLPSFVFLGDDTSSAGANLRLGHVELNVSPTAVPEPSSLLLISCGAAIVVLRRRSRWTALVAAGLPTVPHS